MTLARIFVVGVLMVEFVAAAAPTFAQEDDRAAVGATLASIFNPQRAPPQKTMGLVQRSFLDAAEQSRERLEIALVIDGTESMTQDLEGVRQSIGAMVEDLRMYKGDEQVAVALVVFRDLGAVSGPTKVLLRQFTSNLAELEKALTQLKVETGAPYFPEMVDAGVHAALTELAWSDNPQTTRWLMVFTDAPPYDANFVDSNTDARRAYDTGVLLAKANAKGINIHTILCGSRPEEIRAYNQVLDKTRKFLNDLAGGTGGNMLDLSYPDVRKVILEAARQERVSYQPLGRISREEIDEARRVAPAQEKVRLAILPHLPLKAMSFDPARAEVQFATELRSQLRRSARIDVVSPVDLERQFRAARREALPPEQLLQALATQARADYVLWGDYREAPEGINLRVAAYAQETGEKVAEASLTRTQAASAVGQATNRLSENLQRQRAAEPLTGALASVGKAAPSVVFASKTRSDLLEGLEALEQALGYPVGDKNALELLEKSYASLKAAVELEPQDPRAHFLLANCLYNQAEALRQQGNPGEAEAKRQQFRTALRTAWSFRNETTDTALQREMEADYQLLLNKQPAAAIEHYTALTQIGDSEYALRGHWMLAGIRAGDWGVPAEFIKPEEARRHLIQILALWPESPQAQFIRQALRWSDENGRTEFTYFPQANEWAAR